MLKNIGASLVGMMSAHIIPGSSGSGSGSGGGGGGVVEIKEDFIGNDDVARLLEFHQNLS